MRKSTRILIYRVSAAIILILLGYALYRSLPINKEHFQEQSKLRFINWIDYDMPRNNSIRYFSELFSGCIDNYDEIRIYSIWPKVTQVEKDDSKQILHVQYVGEGDKDSNKNSQLSDLNMFDINIVPGDQPQSNVFGIPFLHFYLYSNSIDVSPLSSKRAYLGNKEKFCLFSVSNGVPQERIEFFKELSKYKAVDSCGKVLNTGYMCPGNYHSDEYRKYISQYKFMICFENTSSKNYLTEKLMIAYHSGTIPIYWGCTNIDEYINRDSILYLKPDYTEYDVNALINTIKLLDENDTLYKKKFEEPLFHEGKVPDTLTMSYLSEAICSRIKSV